MIVETLLLGTGARRGWFGSGCTTVTGRQALVVAFVGNAVSAGLSLAALAARVWLQR